MVIFIAQHGGQPDPRGARSYSLRPRRVWRTTVRGASEAHSTDSTVLLSFGHALAQQQGVRSIPRVWRFLSHAAYSADDLRAKQFVLHAVLQWHPAWRLRRSAKFFLLPDTEAAAARLTPKRRARSGQFLALEHPSGLLYLLGQDRHRLVS